MLDWNAGAVTAFFSSKTRVAQQLRAAESGCRCQGSAHAAQSGEPDWWHALYEHRYWSLVGEAAGLSVGKRELPILEEQCGELEQPSKWERSGPLPRPQLIYAFLASLQHLSNSLLRFITQHMEWNLGTNPGLRWTDRRLSSETVLCAFASLRATWVWVVWSWARGVTVGAQCEQCDCGQGV